MHCSHFVFHLQTDKCTLTFIEARIYIHQRLFHLKKRCTFMIQCCRTASIISTYYHFQVLYFRNDAKMLSYEMRVLKSTHIYKQCETTYSFF